MAKISGIYKIINKINNKYYVGSSVNVKKRLRDHRSKLNHNKHPNLHLQAAFVLYGKENFNYVIVEQNIPQNELFLIEQKYLDICKLEPLTNYNMTYNAFAPATGAKASEETRKKIGIKSKGNKYCLGRKLSNEEKEHLSKINKGKTLTPEHREKIRQSLIGKKHSEQRKINISNSRKGIKRQPFTEEHKNKIGKTNKEIWRLKSLNPQN